MPGVHGDNGSVDWLPRTHRVAVSEYCRRGEQNHLTGLPSRRCRLPRNLRSSLRGKLLGTGLAALGAQRFGGGVLAVVAKFFLCLAGRYIHNAYGITDYVGGALLAGMSRPLLKM